MSTDDNATYQYDPDFEMNRLRARFNVIEIGDGLFEFTVKNDKRQGHLSDIYEADREMDWGYPAEPWGPSDSNPPPAR